MATKSENADIAVLQTQMESLDNRSKATEVKVDLILERLENTYAKKTELRTFKWIIVPLAVLLSTTLTFLVTFYFSHQATNQARDTTVNPTSSTTTTTTTPTGSTSTTQSDGTTGTSTPQTGSQPSNSNGGVQVTVPKVDL